jgi:N-acetylglucosamine malate deacetylase 1
MNLLFVFAHQDDEIGGATRMLRARRDGDRVLCVYLTDGAMRVPAAVRNEESRRALARLGVTDVFFATFPDGNLPEHALEALAFLESQAGLVDEVYTLAWEGGHQDHDAAHLVALAFAERRGLPCREMPLYNGHRSPRSLFRVMHPFGDGWTRRPISLADGLRVVALLPLYQSQRKTWLGLLAETLLKLVIVRREFLRLADPRRTKTKPHGGLLFYERRFGYPYERFARATAELLAITRPLHQVAFSPPQRGEGAEGG